MRTSLNINIPEPCHEDWSKMTGLEKGRHCKSCEKTVFDFTKSTDEYIVKTFLDEGKVCGRFKSTQLNRELVLSRKEKNNYLSYLASALFAFLSFGTQDVEAQGKPRIVKVDSLQSATVNGKIGTSILNERVVRGNIIAESDKIPLPGVTIINLRSKTETFSDFDGNFSLKAKMGDSLNFEFYGMRQIKLIVDYKNVYKVELSENPCDYKNFIVLGFSDSRTDYYLKKKCKQINRQERREEQREKIKNGELERSNIGKLLYNLTNIFRRKE